jgi:hypothetical protein
MKTPKLKVLEGLPIITLSTSFMALAEGTILEMDYSEFSEKDPNMLDTEIARGPGYKMNMRRFLGQAVINDLNLIEVNGVKLYKFGDTTGLSAMQHMFKYKLDFPKRIKVVARYYMGATKAILKNKSIAAAYKMLGTDTSKANFPMVINPIGKNYEPENYKLQEKIAIEFIN